MYIPPSFVESDLQALHVFMEQFSFATLISMDGAEPTASHLPVLLKRQTGTSGLLSGHMARANPQWERAAGQPVLIIFQGPHAYISPDWYEAQNVVPTWNYVSVHAYGVLQLIEDSGRLRELIDRTVQRYESPRPKPWSLQVPDPDFIERLLEGIVGFEIEIDRLEGKWKLSQNHVPERRRRIIAALESTGGHDERQIAALMASRLEQDLSVG